MGRVFLSPPHMGSQELELVKDAFESNWIAPLGPHVDAFEKEIAEAAETRYAAALSSGTAGLHLALILAGVECGDEVLCSTFTFSASANAIRYVGAVPVFVDSEAASWNISPDLLEEAICHRIREGKKPKALIAVDLYGQCADYQKIERLCTQYEITLIEDAAEALGASCNNRPAGSFGRMAVFSFNGNKIITTSGGGMLATDDEELVKRARFLATQARDEAPHYQHSEIGFNYRMSNILAAVGRGQLRLLSTRVNARRANFFHYENQLGSLPGLSFMPEAPWGTCTRWLTCLTIDPSVFGSTREEIRLALNAEDIEARPVWKPMHLQPIFRECRCFGGSFSESIFETGLCLPSGSNLESVDRERVIDVVRQSWRG